MIIKDTLILYCNFTHHFNLYNEMKAIAVVNNIRRHSSESLPPVLLDIPDSCLIRSGKPFFIPEFDSGFRAYPSIAIKISRLGKCVAPRFSTRYWHELTGAVSVRGEHTFERLRKDGLPWSEAVVFDRSLIVGYYVEKDSLDEGWSLSVVCGEQEIVLDETMLRESIDEVIARVSLHNTVRQGDVILVGLAEEGLPLSAPSRLHITLRNPRLNGNQILLTTNIR